MLRSSEKVLDKLKMIRENAQDYFVPLGKMDKSTEAKREISNLSNTLKFRIPLIGAFIKAAQNYPTYVGYDGLSIPNYLGKYSDNIVKLSQAADDSTPVFIRALGHELTHLDQDRRNLLRKNEALPFPSDLVGFVAQRVTLEAAAVASEVSSLYFFARDPYLAHRKKKTLSKKHPEVKTYFEEVLHDENINAIGFAALSAGDGKDVRKKEVFKAVWKEAFVSFFTPNSSLVSKYVTGACHEYLNRANQAYEQGKSFSADKKWGDIESLKAITTLPHYGRMFSDEALAVLQHFVIASVDQSFHKEILSLTQNQVAETYNSDKGVASFLMGLKK
jgi:hypothetical protein